MNSNVSIDQDKTNLLQIRRLSPNATFPIRATEGSVGYDLSAAKACVVPARGQLIVPTDLALCPPDGTFAKISGRSGLASKGITVHEGILDGDYRGNVGVIIFNHSDKDFKVAVGDRVGQLILQKFLIAKVIEVEELPPTSRLGGFGSTGMAALSAFVASS